ncbi:MAG: hypothetical protein GYB33_16330 [Gammaproteobacteria bacterium]|uniref:hypothetical protein n=1 Tax=Pseudomaricurvus alcaniphilus TaxID=1166482 RepID=UPI00140E84DA|nr:hypothetical protein [Pseudomaricurvus alcaniphilus]MBR9911909.1 hypothetical protein [Gammaproteobacteria bacterium]NHN36040.1 hypothetical protein [Pseudomaricurvus alcaniphilus]
MSNSRFREILKAWTKNAADTEELETLEVAVKKSDIQKLQALAEVFNQTPEAITSELLHSAVHEIVEAMPYVAGDKVIRVEDGLNIYEDVGPTPKYLQILKQKQGG